MARGGPLAAQQASSSACNLAVAPAPAPGRFFAGILLFQRVRSKQQPSGCRSRRDQKQVGQQEPIRPPTGRKQVGNRTITGAPARARRRGRRKASSFRIAKLSPRRRMTGWRGCERSITHITSRTFAICGPSPPSPNANAARLGKDTKRVCPAWRQAQHRRGDKC